MAARCTVSARLIIKDNKKQGYITQSHFMCSIPVIVSESLGSSSSSTRSRHGGAAQQANVEQTDRVHPGWHRLRRGPGQRMEVSLSVLQEWRR